MPIRVSRIENHMITSPNRPLTWMHQIRRHASHKPETPALRYKGASTSWAELSVRANRFASLLRTEGIEQGDRVAILLTNRVEFIEVLVGANILGAIAVPINFRLTVPEIRYVIQDSGATFVVSEASLAPYADEALSETGHTPTHLVVDSTIKGPTSRDYESELAGSSDDVIEWPGATSDTALIMYTSGTTGRPKGAMLSYDNMIAQTLTMTQLFELVSESEISLVTSPLFHIAALGSLLPSLCLGHTSVMTPTGSFDAEEYLDLVEKDSVTTSFLVPTQWQTVCDSPSIASRTLTLRAIAWGAAPATPALLRTLNETFPDVKIVTTFGQTEMSPNTTVLRGGDAVRKIGSIGKPLPHIETRVVDENMKEVPQGEIGEIVYRGPSVMQGYWNRPAETAEAFHGGWFHSGDLVRVDEEGFYYIVDRLKDMIISGGENIYCAEVEAAIAEHPLVREVAVVGEPHEHWGETPVAFVVPRDPHNPPTEDEIIALSCERLASYKKPSRIVVLDEMPRNASGKIVKAALRAIVPQR